MLEPKPDGVIAVNPMGETPYASSRITQPRASL
jgi:hypothetical protein